MYRNELAAHRQRFETACQDAAQEWEKIEGELRTLDELDAELRRRKLQTVEPPQVAPHEPPQPPGAGAKAEDYRRLQAELELEIERLRNEAAWLRKVNGVLEARTRGERGDLPLGPPPRRVPATYVLAEWLGLPPMVLLFVGIFGTFGIPAVVGSLGDGSATSLVVPLLLSAVLAFLFLLSWSKLRFLRNCKQAAEVKLLSTVSTSSSYKNWNLPVARGWKVTYDSYTGSGTRSSLEFTTDDGQVGSAEVKGRPYESGVVLYDPDSLVGQCVCRFRCAPHPDARGRWQPGLSVGLTIRVAITALLAAFGLAAPLLGLWFG